ncbi:DoxX family protein [Aestuariimicrobium soli]|uniref:DoxX family protein n=1 Tax=Aestuariimicrobium soli TaxID=2035834 RepID=UPI003EBDE75C
MTDSDHNRPADEAQVEDRPTLAEELAATEPVNDDEGEPTQQFDAVTQDHENRDVETQDFDNQDHETRDFATREPASQTFATQEHAPQEYPTQEPGHEETRVMPAPLVAPEVDPEQERHEALERRRAELAARDRALGNVHRDEAGADGTAEVAPYRFQKRSTDKFLGAFGLFVLRVVVAGILGVHGYQKVTDINATTTFFEQVGVPYANYAAWVVGIAELLAAIALVFGFMVRVVGVGVMAIAIGALVFVRWGSQNPFRAGESGFVGELELLLAAVGFVLFCLGGGGWGMDGGIRRSRSRRKAGL